MRIVKDEYDIRGLAYYQAKGGIYNELITVLTLLRSDPKNRGMAMPAKILNEASYEYDYLRAIPTEDNDAIVAHIAQMKDKLVLCTLAALATMLDDTGILITWAIMPFINNDTQYFPHFKDLIKKGEDYNIEIFEELHGPSKEDQVKELNQELKTAEERLLASEELIRTLEEQLNEAHETMVNQEATISNLLGKKPTAADKNLTLEGILAYIDSKKQYQYTHQIINMLKDKVARVASNEEWEKLLAVEQQIMDQSVQEIHNHNDISNSNVFTGLVNDPHFPIGVDPNTFIKEAVEKYLLETNQTK